MKNNVVKMELTEEAMIMKFEAEQAGYRKALIKKAFMASWLVLMMVAGIFYFNFILIPSVVTSWLSSY